MVAVDRNPTKKEISAVLTDGEGAGVRATEHLLEKGCRSVGFVRGPQGVSTAEKRFAGYKKSLEDSGKKHDPDFVVQGDFTFEGGKEALAGLFEKFGIEGIPDGLVAANDLMAVGVIRQAEELGINVPRELGLVGFDDILLSRLINPSLTTVAAPTYEMGSIGAELLLKELEERNEGVNKVRKKTLKTNLVERESSQFGARKNER